MQVCWTPIFLGAIFVFPGGAPLSGPLGELANIMQPCGQNSQIHATLQKIFSDC